MRLRIVLSALFLAVCMMFVSSPDVHAQGGYDVTTRTLYGRVFDQDTNESIVDATVTVYASNGSVASESNGSNPQEVNLDGTFRFNVFPGVYRIEVSKRGYIPSIFGGANIDETTTFTTNSPAEGGYFYLSQRELEINIPMKKFEGDLDLYDERTVLFVTPDGELSEECNIPPIIGEITPPPQSAVCSQEPTEVTFKILRGDPSIEGVNKECIEVTINGKQVPLQITGAKEAYLVSFELPVIPEGQEAKVRMRACDLNDSPNRVVKEVTFTSDCDIVERGVGGTLDEQLSRIEHLIATGNKPFGIGVIMLGLLTALLSGVGVLLYYRHPSPEHNEAYDE